MGNNIQDRKGFIGGTDAIKIMKGEWFKLWEIKTGRKKPEDLTDPSHPNSRAVRMGILSEPLNQEFFEEHTALLLKKTQVVMGMNWNGVPLRATLDGQLLTGDIVEFKHTNAFFNMEGCIDYYKAQIQFYLWVSGADKLYFSVIFGNASGSNGYQVREIKKDPSYITVMKDLITEFWGYVRDDKQPEYDDLHVEPKADNMPVDDMIKRDGSKDNRFIDAFHTLVETETDAIVNKNARKDLVAMLGDNEREVYCELGSVKRTKTKRLIVINKGELK